MPQQDSPSHVDEQSPLISPENTDHNDEVIDLPLSQFLDLADSSVESKSAWYLFLLTLSIGGLQITWSVEISNGSPFLLSLGMSKSLVAVVWLAGPLSGVLVQPYIGILSDNCRVSWGKRKPYMIFGALATIASLMAMAWTKEIVLGIVTLFNGDPEGNAAHVMILTYATVLMWILDCSINTGR
jgi:solute carrier family 45, member 1/2/4